MIKINQTIDEIPILTESMQPSLPLPLPQPISLVGMLHDKAMIQAIFEQISKAAERSTKPSMFSPIQINVGVDEVGRGPLYGSVVVSSVILPFAWSAKIETSPLQDTPLSILTDSKKLTEAKRERLFPLLKEKALGFTVVDVPASVIDELNILQATLTGMRLACECLMTELMAVFTQYQNSGITVTEAEGLVNLTDYIQFNLLIDGNKIPLLDWKNLNAHGLGEGFGEKVVAEAWIKGDARHTAIAAASVLAKVTRDRQMVQDGLVNVGYGLEKHKGYPTKAHLHAIQEYGVLPEHRRSFKPIKQVLGLMD